MDVSPGRLRVDGARELRASLKEAGRGVQDLKDAHRKVADVVAQEARPYAPVGPPEGGHIKDTVRTSGTASAAIVRIGRARNPYGGPIHWGWRDHGIKPNPWVYDAAKRTAPEWFDIYATAVQKIIDETVEGTPTP